jgi:hypothetical protein
VFQTAANIEGPVQDRLPDGQAPQRAGLARFGIVVRQGTDLLCRKNQGVRVVKIGQGDRRGPHQRTVAARVPGEGVVLGSSRRQVVTGRLCLAT